MSNPPPDIQVATGVREVELFRAAELKAIAALHAFAKAENAVAGERRRLASYPDSPGGWSRLSRAEAKARMQERHLDHAEAVAARLEAAAMEVASDLTVRARLSWGARMAHRALEAGRRWD
ncbi:hypothetical protein ABT299_50055 [Spirillospora sp. NPDC000708]